MITPIHPPRDVRKREMGRDPEWIWQRRVRLAAADLGEPVADVPAPEPLPQPPDPHRYRPLIPISRTLAAAYGQWRRIPYWWIYRRAKLARLAPATAAFIVGLIRSGGQGDGA